ncbi:MAG TPA: M1 family aminopeptidase [Pyrinomonadaceae bacterium]|nr:M1 family aminopeptidase [Pyrinomonadaceae bacterium]
MKRRLSNQMVLILVLILALGPVQVLAGSNVPAADKTPVQVSQAGMLPQTRYIPDHDFDTRHIALDLHFNWEREEVSGTETFVFKPLVANLHRIELDAAEMTVTSARMAGATLKYEMDLAAQKLRVELERPFQPTDEVTVVLEYHTNGPQTKLAGLVGAPLRFIKPTPDEPMKPRQIWSQGESEYNHYWFPCYDHPNDFFSSEITATVEKPLSVISNGKLLETKENRDGTRSFHWKIDQPHAGYLTSIIIGEYVPITGDYEGIPIVSNVYPDQVQEGKVTTARLTEMVKFFSEKTGVKYPYAKYAQTMAREFGGGMENISATTQTDNMIHDARTELDSNSDGLQSHELAHQWFGDYVTCRDWSDIWLNESFATYFQAMWDEHKLGRDDFLYSDVKANQDAYLKAWRAGKRRPIVTKNYADPDSVFDTYAYPRGGAVLHMLRQTLGEENWSRAINYYLRKYANQPVETEQFRIAVEESTGQALDWFFDQWLYKMGHPVFRVTQTYKPGSRELELSVEQLQKLDTTSQFPQVTLFQMPVKVEIVTQSGTKVQQIQIQAKQQQSFSFQVESKPLLVNFDYQGTLIKELEFDKTTDELAYQLTRDADVLGRVWALNQLRDRVRSAGTAEAERQNVAARLARVLVDEKFWGVRVDAAEALGELKSSVARDALVAATKDTDARVRASAVTSLATFPDPSLAVLFTKLLGDQSYAVVKAAALALGQTKTPTAYDSLVNVAKLPSWRDNIKAYALSGLKELRDKRALGLALRSGAIGNTNQVRAAALRLLGAIGQGNDDAFSLVARTGRAAFDSGNKDLGTAAGEALVSLGDPKGLEVLDQINKSPALPIYLKPNVERFREQLQKAVAGAENHPRT